MMKEIWLLTDQGENLCRSQCRRFEDTHKYRWFSGYLQCHCKLTTPIECPSMNFLLSLNLLCRGLFSHSYCLLNECYVYATQKRLMGWKHLMDVSRWKCILHHVWFSLILISWADTEGSCIGSHYRLQLELTGVFFSVLAYLSLTRSMSFSWACLSRLAFDGLKYL